MPEYFPPNILSILNDTKFVSEKKVFLSLYEKLDKEVKIYSQCEFLKTTIEGNMIEGESDFIILVPQRGILFLEVKGGIVSYRANEKQWKTLRRDTNTTFKIKDPLKQAKNSMYSIIELLKKQNPHLLENYNNFSYAACLPDTPKPLDPRPFGPDKPQELFLFKDHLGNLKEEIDKILNWFQGNNKEIQMDNKFLQQFDKLIIGNNLPVKIPLKQSLEIENEEMNFSTAQSFYLKTLPNLNYVALNGGAGTGKTLLAIELIRTLSDSKKILFLCFNKPLARHVRYSMKKTQGDIHIHNCHQWVSNLKRKYSMPRTDTNMDMSLEIENLVSKVIDEKDKYDVIIIDEAQDFDDEWMINIELMLRKKGKFFVFYDQQQSIFERKSQYFLKEKFSHLELDENFRNTNEIFQLFKNFNSQKNFISRGIAGTKPEFINVKTYEQQFKWIGEKINHLKQHEGIELREMGVLIYDGLKPTNIKNLSKIIPSITQAELCSAEYVQPDQIMFDTVNRIKGLEIPIMFLTNFISPLEDQRLYVSLSRAKHRIYIVGLESKIEELKKRIIPLVQNN